MYVCMHACVHVQVCMYVCISRIDQAPFNLARPCYNLQYSSIIFECVLIANIGKEREKKNVEQRDKEDADNVTGVGGETRECS
jgi:hypothetical protein